MSAERSSTTPQEHLSGRIVSDSLEQLENSVAGEEIKNSGNVDPFSARAQEIGRAGEQIVLTYERHRLKYFGLPDLADAVEHVAVTRGDGAGYDILSFESDGSDRFIEVKTTTGARGTPFFITHNELAFARMNQGKYKLYRLFEFNEFAREARLVVISGSAFLEMKITPVAFKVHDAEGGPS